MKKGSKLIIIVSLVSVLLSFFSFTSVAAASSSSVSNVIISDRRVISDFTFQVAMNDTTSTVSGENVINVSSYNTTDAQAYKYSCEGWEFAADNNGDQSTSMTCKLYYGTSTSQAAQKETEVNAAHVDQIILHLKETFGNDVHYNYTVKNIKQIIFTDDKTHTGYLSFTDPDNNAWLSDSENVAVYSTTNTKRIYFFGKGAFNIYYQSIVRNTSSETIPSSSQITIDSFHEAASEVDTQSIIDAIVSASDRNHLDLSSILDYMQDYKQYDFPEESFALNWAFMKRGIDTIPIDDFTYWKYPLFDFKQGNSVNFIVNANSIRYLVLGVNVNAANVSSFNQFFSVSEGVTVKSVSNLLSALPQFRFIRVELENATGSNINNQLQALTDMNVFAIYYGTGLYLTEDFAARWFENQLQQSGDQFTAGADEASTVVDEFSDYSEDLHDMDVTALDDLDDKLDSIDLDTSHSILGNNKFLQSANFVRTNFNYFVNNSPIGSLITFSLTIGLILILLGKLRT